MQKSTLRTDEIDYQIIFLIYFGVNQCTYLSAILNLAKSSIHYRIKKLSRLKMVYSIDQPAKFYYRVYILDESVKSKIKSILDSNKVSLTNSSVISIL